MSAFELDKRLEGDSVPVADLPLSAVGLMNERSWPWLILVPRRAGLVELIDLDAADPASWRRSPALPGPCAPFTGPTS